MTTLELARQLAHAARQASEADAAGAILRALEQRGAWLRRVRQVNGLTVEIPMEVPTMATTQKREKNQNLPGIEKGIPALEQIAEAYADVRDRRSALTREEVALKSQALTLMHKHNKSVYKRDGIEIILTPGEETIKVKVTKAGDDGGDDGDE
jgi:hypothetical protein